MFGSKSRKIKQLEAKVEELWLVRIAMQKTLIDERFRTSKMRSEIESLKKELRKTAWAT